MIKLDISYPDYYPNKEIKISQMISLYTFDEIYHSIINIESQCHCFEKFKVEFFKNLNSIKENTIDL